ncbi:MAG: phage baseplate protein [Gammaproteobacteria bacterium]
MHVPTAAELLNAWENGLRQGPIDRALGLLEAVYPDLSAETVAELCIGERDSRLLRVREVLFGPRITSTTQCPRCSERLEWESEVAELCINEGKTSTSELCVEAETYRLRFRLPNSRDLAALSKGEDGINDRRKQLLERCLLEASTSDGESIRIEQLPETALQAMVREMDRADPQSNLNINLTCPACGHCWEGLFDIVSFLWAEINNWAERTLRTVHLLARVYGWREADILAMSPTRRQIYLEMASQ